MHERLLYPTVLTRVIDALPHSQVYFSPNRPQGPLRRTGYAQKDAKWNKSRALMDYGIHSLDRGWVIGRGAWRHGKRI